MRAIILAAAALLAGCASLGSTEGNQALAELMQEGWQGLLTDAPYYATGVGVPGHDHKHPDLSPEAIAKSEARQRATLSKLDAIRRESLSAEDQINYDLFRALIEDASGTIANYSGTNFHRFKPQQLAIDPLFGGPQHFPAILAVTPFKTDQDYENFITRLRGLHEYTDQLIAQLRLGMAAGRTQPKPVIKRIIAQAKSVASPKASEHELYRPFGKMPKNINAARKAELQKAALAAMEDKALPAFRKFHAFLKDEYLPVARTSIGATDLPGGADYYAACIRKHTTTTLSADEIHAIGMREVDRLRKEMQAILDEVGFNGSISAYGAKLRKDPKQIYKTGEESLAAHRAFAKELDPLMSTMFGYLPRQPYGVEPMPDAAALSGGAPYYNQPSADGSRAGAFFINTLKPELQPAYDMPALVAHEAVPGHHLQIAIAQELDDLPDFRRNAYYTAYGEGWALYAENLAGELGAYKTPEQRFGAYTAEIWRAVRLVVDTGMHAKGWSRDKAIKFFAENSPQPTERIEAEIDRYIAWPGQALGYKMGQLKIKELRAEAEAKLGDRFDIRSFHDEVLGAGAMPLSALETRMDAWVDRQ